MKKKIKNLLLKIHKDYEDWLKFESVKKPIAIVNNSYQNAIILNFYDGIVSFIDDYITNEDEYFILSQHCLNKLLSYDGNLLIKLKECYMGFLHPERFDFWFNWYDGLADVIEIIAKQFL